MKKIVALWIVLSIVSILLSSCTSTTVSEVKSITPAIASSPVPTISTLPTSTPLPLPSRPSIPQAALETLSGQASPACEQAFKSSLKKQSVSAQVMTMVNYTYDEQGWRYIRNSEQVNNLVEARSPEDVKTLVCVRVTRSKYGTYMDGAGAYVLAWTVRIVTWPENVAVAEKTFSGDKPPKIKTGGGDRYGMSPYKGYREWLLNLFAGDSVFVQGTSVAGIAFSADGKYLVVAGNDYAANIWDIALHKIIFTQSGKSNIFNNMIPLAFSPDQKILAMGTLGGVNLLSSGIWKRSAEIKAVDVWDAVFSSDGDRLIAGMSRGYNGIRIYDPASGSQTGNFKLQSPVSQVILSPDDRTLIGLVYSCPTCGPNPDVGIFIWNFKNGDLIQNIKIKDAQSLALLKDGNTLAIAALNMKDIKLYDLSNGTNIGKLSGHAEPVNLLAVSQDGRWLASTDSKGNVIIWDQRTAQIAFTYSSAAKVSAMAFSPDGSRLALGSVAGVVEFWDFLK